MRNASLSCCRISWLEVLGRGSHAGDIMPTDSFLPVPSAEGIAAFQKLYAARFGHFLTDDEARDLASRYLLLYHLGTTKIETQVDNSSPMATIRAQEP